MTANNPASDAEKLTAAFAALRSADVLIQNEGVADAIQLGAVAVPGLLSLLAQRDAPRAQVMYALAQIGDARAEQFSWQDSRTATSACVLTRRRAWCRSIIPKRRRRAFRP